MSSVIKFGAGDNQSHVLPPKQILKPLSAYGVEQSKELDSKQFAFSLRNADKHKLSQGTFENRRNSSQHSI